MMKTSRSFICMYPYCKRILPAGIFIKTYRKGKA